MNILLVNPPDSGRSIPEERYGITSLRQIFRGEPLALEELAGNLERHTVRIADLKAAPDSLEGALEKMCPQVVGITGVTCEANTMLALAGEIRRTSKAQVVVGGIHASNDPSFFLHPCIDYIVRGIGKRVFALLVDQLERYGRMEEPLPGVLAVDGLNTIPAPVHATPDDLVAQRPPAYQLTAPYRSHYILEKLGITMGFVASAFGCPHHCSFCSIRGQTGGRYLVKPIAAVVRDIRLLEEPPVIRLVDANTFGDPDRAMALCRAIREAGIRKQFLADIRADTVVRHPEMVQAWKEIGLRAVIIGFEEISDQALAAMHKDSRAAVNDEAISILHDMGITIVGDFILSPEYEEEDFTRLARYLESRRIDLPMITVMTPLPGTPLYRRLKKKIINHNLEYYTLTNAVLPTRLKEKTFYSLYANLLETAHGNARI